MFGFDLRVCVDMGIMPSIAAWTIVGSYATDKHAITELFKEY